MYKLYFENKYGSKIYMGTFATEEGAVAEFMAFCRDHNLKVHYTRNWIEPNGDKYYDVGSHSEFFIIREVKK